MVDPEFILEGLFSVAALLQVVYLIGFCRVFIVRKRPAQQSAVTHSQPPVSVIVCAKDEFKQLQHFMPLLLDQQYPRFEVILVNDHSTDETVSWAKEMMEKHPQLRLCSLPEGQQGKKAAVTLGVKQSQYEHLLFTDADCWPKSPSWIAQMTRPLNEKKQLVLGYGGYQHRPGMLNTLIRYDTMMIAVQYFSLARWGVPYMGVGRNLAYQKALFDQVGGLQRHQHVASGDDDLFVQDAATADNCAIVMEESAHTLSLPKSSWNNWFKQKRRHLTTGPLYHWRTQLILGVWEASKWLFYITMALLLFSSELGQAGALGWVLVRYILFYLCIYQATKVLCTYKIFLFSPLMEIGITILNPILVTLNRLQSKSQHKWKN